MKRLMIWLIGAILLAYGAAPSPALASGYAVPEQSASATGQGIAVVARGLDASSNWYNPAAITELPGIFNGLAGFAYIDIKGVYRPDGGVARDQHVEEIVSPYGYGTLRLHPRVVLGFGVNTPYGLVQDYGENWDGQQQITRVELRVTILNPNIAIEIPKKYLSGVKLSLATGIGVGFAKLRLSRRIDQFSLVGDSTDAFVTIRNDAGDFPDPEDDILGVNWHFGLHARYRNLTFGLSYKSKMGFHGRGEADFYGVNSALQSTLVDQEVRTRIIVPQTVWLGVSYYFFQRLELEFDAHWTDWTSFSSLPLNFIESETLDSNDERKWKSTWAFRLGGRLFLIGAPFWKTAKDGEKRLLSPKFQVYATGGLFYDNNPIPDSTFSPILADSDRYGFNLGVGVNVGNMGVDAGIVFVFADRREKNNLEGTDSGDPTVTSTANGDYEASAIIFTLQARLRF